jgi:foldase protein PrsA
MNDKVKGLVLGLSLGIMLTGTVAYASGTQIEVYFKSIKYMFDGQEKNPTAEQGEGFIYNGTTYVPLRFVSEALGKDVAWDGDTDTVWVGKKVDLSTIVATYQGGQVNRGLFEKYLRISHLLNPKNAQYDNDDDYKTYMIKQLIGQQILSGRLTDDLKAAVNKTVDEQLIGLNDYLKKSSGLEVKTVLSNNNLTEADVRYYAEIVIGAEKWMEASITEDKIKAAYDQEVNSKSEKLMTASVRHILIGVNDPKGNPRSKEEINKIVKEVQDKLNQGGSFTDLAKQYSEDPGSKDNGGFYADAAVGNWVEPFKKAVLALDLNKISEPVETEFGVHFIRVEGRGTLPYDKAKEEIKAQLKNESTTQFNEKELPSLVQKIELPKP